MGNRIDLNDEREVAQYVAGPQDEWLGQYISYARSLTDAPIAFHVGGGLAVLATAVGSNIYWYGGGAREQWPNLYMLLIGPSGTRKSTSVDLPTEPLKIAVPGSIMDQEFTPERFVQNLARQPASLIRESEFASLLERMKSSYMNGFKQRLTDLYDCHLSYERSVMGMGGQGEKISIIRPSLSILAASTMDWLVQSLVENDMRSGFMPRFLIISAQDREPEPPGGYYAIARANVSAPLISALRKLSQMQRRKLSFDPVRDRLVAWESDHRAVLARGGVPEEMGGLYNRLGHHTAKICALLRLSAGPISSDGDAVVTDDIADRAMLFMDWVLAGTTKMFEERVVFSKFEQEAQKCLRHVGAEASWSALLKRMRCPAEELEKIIKTLEMRGDIASEWKQQTGGRNGRIIRRVIETPRLITPPVTPLMSFPNRILSGSAQ